MAFLTKTEQNPEQSKNAIMKQLLNSCYRTEIKVFPANWNTTKARISKKYAEWYVWYRFYDPAYKNRWPNGKVEKRRGMNKFKDLKERQDATRKIIEMETRDLDEKNYNPITKTYMRNLSAEKEKTKKLVSTDTGLIDALDIAYENVKAEPCTIADLKSVITYAWAAAERRGLATKPIGTVETSDMMELLDEVGRYKNEIEKAKAEDEGRDPEEKWTASNFNHYKAYLGMLFKFLKPYGVYKNNPLTGIDNRIETEPQYREVLTDAEYKDVDQALKEYNYYYWRFVKIFEESGARRREILGVQDVHVELEKRKFWVLVKKRKDKYSWECKYIENDVLPLWKEVMDEAAELRKETIFSENTQELRLYLFSVGLKVMFRDRPIRAEQVTRRWRKHIKNKMEVTADLYSVKHGRSTKEVDDFINEIIQQAQQIAAEKNSHTTSEMVRKVYDVKSRDRVQLIKEMLANSFKTA